MSPRSGPAPRSRSRRTDLLQIVEPPRLVHEGKLDPGGLRRLLYQRNELGERVRPYSVAQVLFREPFLGVAHRPAIADIGGDRTPDASARRTGIGGQRMQRHRDRARLTEWHKPLDRHSHASRKHVSPDSTRRIRTMECEMLDS